MVAQPRRISAISLATRVAAERCAPLGGDVGYTIRLENKCASTYDLPLLPPHEPGPWYLHAGLPCSVAFLRRL